MYMSSMPGRIMRVLTDIAEYKVNRIDELLPWNVADKLKSATSHTPAV